MYIIVFSLIIFTKASVLRKAETKVDEQGRKYHYSEKYEEEFFYENDKCFEDESDAQLEVQNEFKYDEDSEGFGESKEVYAEKEEVKENVEGFGDGEEVYPDSEDLRADSKTVGFGKGMNIYKEEETNKAVVGFGDGEEVYEKEKEPQNLRGFGAGDDVYSKDANEKETIQSGFGEPLGTIDDYEASQVKMISLNKRRIHN